MDAVFREFEDGCSMLLERKADISLTATGNTFWMRDKTALEMAKIKKNENIVQTRDEGTNIH